MPAPAKRSALSTLIARPFATSQPDWVKTSPACSGQASRTAATRAAPPGSSSTAPVTSSRTFRTRVGSPGVTAMRTTRPSAPRSAPTLISGEKKPCAATMSRACTRASASSGSRRSSVSAS